MATTTLTPAASRSMSSLYAWLTTTDHKKIGILYVVNSFVFFFIGGLLAMGVRTELAQPGMQFFTPAGYNEVFTMHATFMIFLFVIPMLAGFGNYIVPAPDRGAGHGLPADQRPVVLDAAARRDPAPAELRDRRVGSGRLDELRAAVGGPGAGRDGHRPGPVDRRTGAHRDELDPRCDQLPGHDVQDAGARA